MRLHPHHLAPALALALTAVWSLSALFPPAARAAIDGVSTGGCEVLASGQLRSNDYLHSFQGECRAGLAEGRGKATWKLRHAPDAPPVVWEGRFSQGIFLAERHTVGARRVDNTRVLLDQGRLDGPGNASAGRLWVESRIDGKLPASICQPLSLQVSTSGGLADDALAKAWMDAAYARWQSTCGDAGMAALKGRSLRVQLHEGGSWSPDAYGNIPAGTAQALRHWGSTSGPQGDWQGYTNRAAQKVADAQRAKQETDEARANEARIRAFARKHGATRYVELAELDRNPFRFGGDALLIAVRLAEARTPVEAYVTPARASRAEWARVILRGPIADWDEQPRIVAVRVKGRSTDPYTRDMLLLEMVDSQRCSQPDCEDYLYMPGRRWLRDESFNARLERVDAQPLRTAGLR